MVIRTKETPKLPEINVPRVLHKLISEIKATVSACKKGKVLLAVSGGTDTSVLADLCCRALGSDSVYGLQMTHSCDTELQTKDGAILARHLRIRMRKMEITPPVELLAEMLRVPFHGEEAQLRRYQIIDRLRMMIMLDVAEQEGMHHLSALNLTEQLLGLGVVCGTFAPVAQPLSQLYKTYIFELADYLGLPEQIRIRQPSFELWRCPIEGSEPREVIREIDKVLYLRTERNFTPSKIKRAGFAPRFVSSILKRLSEAHATQ
ncbi:MAG: NAD(+) synthase [Candidatus Riflebacteria bacterium RBG_13_59_9]|nr:MAG: NAD(+) synthase [Candidatus Riflebacteria bacterium RBG_13_59_9]